LQCALGHTPFCSIPRPRVCSSLKGARVLTGGFGKTSCTPHGLPRGGDFLSIEGGRAFPPQGWFFNWAGGCFSGFSGSTLGRSFRSLFIASIPSLWILGFTGFRRSNFAAQCLALTGLIPFALLFYPPPHTHLQPVQSITYAERSPSPIPPVLQTHQSGVPPLSAQICAPFDSTPATPPQLRPVSAV